MTESRIHRAASADGTEIVGRVIGHGPPLVLVHGAIGDGEFAWTELLPHLTDQFTCYLPSTRGRGRSDDHPDHSLPRLSEDITAFVATIAEPVCMMGWSGGGPLALGAADAARQRDRGRCWESGASPRGPAPEVQVDLGRLGVAMEQVGLAAQRAASWTRSAHSSSGSATTRRSPRSSGPTSTTAGRPGSRSCWCSSRTS